MQDLITVSILGHDDRVFNVTLSPDASTIATISGDEIICLWKSFEMDPVKKAKEKMVKSTTNITHQSIR